MYTCCDGYLFPFDIYNLYCRSTVALVVAVSIVLIGKCIIHHSLQVHYCSIVQPGAERTIRVRANTARTRYPVAAVDIYYPRLLASRYRASVATPGRPPRCSGCLPPRYNRCSFHFSCRRAAAKMRKYFQPETLKLPLIPPSAQAAISKW